MESIDDSFQGFQKFSGFSLASGSSALNVSEDSIRKAKMLLSPFEEDIIEKSYIDDNSNTQIFNESILKTPKRVMKIAQMRHLHPIQKWHQTFNNSCPK